MNHDQESPQGPGVGQIKLIYIALMMGIVIFGAVIIAMPIHEHEPDVGEHAEQVVDVLAIIACALTLIPGFVSRMIGRAFARKGMASSPIPLQAYAAGKIMGAAMAEGPGLLWCVLAFRTGEQLYLVGAAVCVLLILTQMPSEEEVRELSGEDAWPEREA